MIYFKGTRTYFGSYGSEMYGREIKNEKTPKDHAFRVWNFVSDKGLSRRRYPQPARQENHSNEYHGRNYQTRQPNFIGEA